MFDWRLARPPGTVSVLAPHALSNTFLADRLFFKEANPTSEQITEWTANYINLLPIDIDTLAGTLKALYRPLSINEARLHSQGYIADKDIISICKLWSVGDTEPYGIFRELVLQKILMISGSEMAAVSEEEQVDMYRDMHMMALEDSHNITNKYIQLVMFAFDYRYEDVYNRPLGWIYMMVEMAKNKFILTQNISRAEVDTFIRGNRPLTEEEVKELGKKYMPNSKEYIAQVTSWDQYLHKMRNPGGDTAMDAAQLVTMDPSSLR